MTTPAAPRTGTRVVALGPGSEGAEATLTGPGSPTGPLVVSAPAARFDFDTLERLARAGVRAGRAFGLLPSDLDRPTAPPSATDGHWLHAGRSDNDSPGLQPAETLAALGRSWTLLSVFGHGDGMHINMDGVVLCGVAGEHETLDGRPVEGGCSASADRCKKQGALADVRRARDLRCRVLLLLSCNSLALGAQLYPSDNSIAVAAWTAGAAQAVIGTTRQTGFAPGEAEHAGRMVLSGAPLGDVVRELNRERLAAGREGFYVLLGDPMWRAPAASRRRAAGPSGRRKAAAPPRPQPLPERELLARSADGRRLTTALRIVCRSVAPGGGDKVLRRLESVRYTLEQRTWTAVAHQQLTGTFPPTVHQRLVAATTAWQDACRTALDETGLLAAGPGGDVGDRLTRALAMFADPTPQTPSDTTCDRCRGQVLVRPLRFPDAAAGTTATRAVLECAGCGPRGNVLLTAVPGRNEPLPVLSTTGFPAVRKGIEAVFELRYSTVGAVTGVPLLLQVRDKSRPLPLPEAWYDLPPGRTHHTVPFRIPADSGSDIFSARAVVVRGGSLEILRCVFPVH
ncbi:hypothetical protein [Kitasatospora sp. NPDC058046]|uniref:hypothetical protein n=1 Tax=Kitasatospora sp. NPDC058046 TaxID=3346312 RepID=UPI0036DD573E